MPSAVIGALRVDLDLNTAAFSAGAARAAGQAQALSRQMQTIGAGMTRLGQGMSIAVTAPLVALVATSIPAATQARQALGQVEAANRSMHNASKLSTQQLQEQATALMNLSNFDDDDILQKVTANLLTFGNVTGATFGRAQQAIVDISARMGTDLQSSALMVGKALNAPVQGLAALRRVGIQFTTQQVTQIRSMVAHNNVIGAQAVMLTELERQFGGAAAAMRRATPGQDAIQAWNTFKETVGEIALRFLPPLSAALAHALDLFSNLDPHTQNVVAGFAAIAAVIGPLLMVFGPLISGVGSLVGVFTSVAASGITIGGILAAIGAAILPVTAAAAAAYLVWQNWGTIGPMLQDLFTWIQNTIGPPAMQIIDALRTSLTQLWEGPFGNLLRAVFPVIQFLGNMFVQVMGTMIPRVINALAAVIVGIIQTVTQVVNAIAALLTGDFSGAWEAAKAAVVAVVTGIGNVIEALVPGALGALSRLFQGAKRWLVDKFWELYNLFMAPIRAIDAAFAWLHDRVVGHSWIPDMVDGIGHHIARLDAEMAQPVERHTQRAGRAFKGLSEKAREAAQRVLQAFREMQGELRQLLERLFPESASARQFAADLTLLTEHSKRLGLSATETAAAIDRLWTDRLNSLAPPEAVIPESWMNDNVLEEAMRQGLRGVDDIADRGMRDVARVMGLRTREIAESFSKMASDAIGSVRSMVDAFKGGDILGGIQQLLNAVVQVIGAVRTAQGKSPTIPSGPGAGFHGFATGGSFTVGGRPGTDNNLISFRATKGEMVNITRPGQSRGGYYFDLRGAVMTEDLLAQMNAIGDGAAARGAAGGLFLSNKVRRKRARHSLVGAV